MKRSWPSGCVVGLVCAFGACAEAGASAFELVGMTTNMDQQMVPLTMFLALDGLPQPPGTPAMLDLGMPSRPMLMTESANPQFCIVIGLNLPAVQFQQFLGFDTGEPDMSGRFNMMAEFGDGSVFDVSLFVGGSSPIKSGSWVGLNPQPEVPSFPGAVMFQFELDGGAARGDPTWNATVAVEITNGREIVSFEVPGAGGATVFACAGLLGVRRRRAR